MDFLKKLLLVYLGVLAVYWLVLAQSGLQTDFWNYFFSFSFSLIPLIGGVIGINIARSWGLLKSAIGRAIFFISAGSFAWGAGSMIWSYYNFFQDVAAPYPSLADVGFVLSILLWLIGMVNLSRATGAKFALRNIKGKLFLVLASIIIMVLSYYVLVVIARDGVVATDQTDKMKLFFDIVYPGGDVLILLVAVAILGLSFQYFGGVYKRPILLLLFGFGVMYMADFVFSYTTTIETFYNGNFGDLLFTIALFLITFGVFGFSKSSQEIPTTNQSPIPTT